MTHRKVALIILDGWGIGAGDRTDAIAQARTPFVDSLRASVPHATLRTDGLHVGLPEGQMGNSEVGHINIGAGRVVYQDLVRVDKAVADGSLERNDVLQGAFAKAAKPGKRLHLMGLVSKGGVHSKQSHLAALCHMAKRAGLKDVVIHAFADGRDAAPKSGMGYMAELLRDISGTPARVATVCGRYYAMDRDKRWERIKRAYELMVHGVAEEVMEVKDVFEQSYAQNITDEFIVPHRIAGVDGAMRSGDVVLCFNFRTDRCREITVVLTQKDMPELGMHTVPLHYVTMTEYDSTFKHVRVLFRKDDLQRTIGEVVANAGLSQLRAAETEKYPHVTYFFSGGREVPFNGEERIMAASPKVATYDLQPEMSAPELAQRVADALSASKPDLVCLNFANPDMVGHTGVFPAVVKAVEVTDRCLQQVVEAGKKNGYSFIIIADHGNADKAMNPDGTPHTAHTTNPVPIFIVDDRGYTLRSGILADVAPTVLALMGLEQPTEMTGTSLLVK